MTVREYNKNKIIALSGVVEFLVLTLVARVNKHNSRVMKKYGFIKACLEIEKSKRYREKLHKLQGLQSDGLLSSGVFDFYMDRVKGQYLKDRGYDYKSYLFNKETREYLIQDLLHKIEFYKADFDVNPYSKTHQQNIINIEFNNL